MAVSPTERILEGCTDAGSMVIFDPAALPDDFDAKHETDTVEQLEDLARAGLLYWLDTHADGGYTLGIFVGDCLPDRLQPYAKRIDAYEQLQLPSGRLFFTGVEYAFQSDDSRLRKYPHVGAAADVQPGRYRAEFFEFEYPEDYHEDMLRRRLPANQFRVHELMNALVRIAVISAIVCAVTLLSSLFRLRWGTWTTVILACGFPVIGLPILLYFRPSYRQASSVYGSIQKEFCDYGVLLHRLVRETVIDKT
jgi:hypothetical protein